MLGHSGAHRRCAPPQTDIDAYLLGDVLDELMGNPTLVSGLSDRQLDGSAPPKGPDAFVSYCDPPEAACQSTGFMFLRPHPIVVEEVDVFLAAMQARRWGVPVRTMEGRLLRRFL